MITQAAVSPSATWQRTLAFGHKVREINPVLLLPRGQGRGSNLTWQHIAQQWTLRHALSTTFVDRHMGHKGVACDETHHCHCRHRTNPFDLDLPRVKVASRFSGTILAHPTRPSYRRSGVLSGCERRRSLHTPTRLCCIRMARVPVLATAPTAPLADVPHCRWSWTSAGRRPSQTSESPGKARIDPVATHRCRCATPPACPRSSTGSLPRHLAKFWPSPEKPQFKREARPLR